MSHFIIQIKKLHAKNYLALAINLSSYLNHTEVVAQNEKLLDIFRKICGIDCSLTRECC